jgi:hypothetical protein
MIYPPFGLLVTVDKGAAFFISPKKNFVVQDPIFSGFFSFFASLGFIFGYGGYAL